MKTSSFSRFLPCLIVLFSLYWMLRHDIDIQIGAYGFPYATEVQVDSSWENLTDTATVQVPRKITMNGRPVAQGDSLFRRGDAVSIRLGYDGRFDEVFSGYVSGISPRSPLEFRCEDAMWLLKKQPVTVSYRSVNLRKLLADIIPIPFEAVDAELGPWRISNATPAQVLEELRKTYSLQSWVRDGKLYSGLAYWPTGGKTHRLRFGYHTDDQWSDLEYMRADDVRLKVRAISIEPDNTRLQAEIGDPNGELRTLTYYALGSEAALRSIAERDIERLRYEGYRGTVKTFGQPAVRHGDIVELQDDQYPDRNGGYLVKRVVTTAGVAGYRQEIELDTKI